MEFPFKTKILNSLKGYQILRSDHDYDGQNNESASLGSSNCSRCLDRHSHTCNKYQRFVWFVSSGWGFSTCLIVLLSVLLWYPDRGLKTKCFRETSSYSPLVGKVPDSLREFRFNGSIRWPSPYRGPPSPDVDHAWEKISMFRPLNIKLSDAEFLNIGKSRETVATNPPEYGGGIFVQPEFSHQLHCVNLLRKASYFKYSYYKVHDSDFRDKDETFKVHLDHCVEMLRQFVMCHADVGLVTAHWIKQRARPWPDFNTKHICRDFEGIWQWTVDHQMPEGTPMIPLKPSGARVLSSPP